MSCCGTLSAYFIDLCRFVLNNNNQPYLISLAMTKYLTLIALVFSISTANAQTKEQLGAKFIYEKLVDIYHKSLSVNPEEYFSEFGYDLVSDKDSPDGNIIHRAVADAGVNHLTLTNDEIINGWGDKEFSFTTHSLSKALYATIESRYSTRSRKEYKNLLNYVISISYKLISDNSHPMETQTYQMDKLQIVFQKSNGDDPRPYKIIYSINAN